MILFLAKTRSDGSCSAPERHPHCFHGELNQTGLDATPDTNFQPGMLRQPLQPRPVFFTVYWCLQADPGTRRQMVLSDALLRGPPVCTQRMSSVTAAQVMDNNPLQDPSPKARLLWLFDSLVTNVFCLGLSASTWKGEGCPCPVPAHPFRVFQSQKDFLLSESRLNLLTEFSKIAEIFSFFDPEPLSVTIVELEITLEFSLPPEKKKKSQYKYPCLKKWNLLFQELLAYIVFNHDWFSQLHARFQAFCVHFLIFMPFQHHFSC